MLKEASITIYLLNVFSLHCSYKGGMYSNVSQLGSDMWRYRLT